MVKKKVGSITLAVGLITAGALLFAQNFIDIPVKDIYKYWPVLLIGLGLEMILYMLFYGRNNAEVKLSVDGLCIVFIIIVGLISNGIKLMDVDFPGRFFSEFGGGSIIDGIRYRTEIKETYSKDNISGSFDVKELRVTNDSGDIKVLPYDGKGIKLEAVVRVKCNDENKARGYSRNAIEIKEGEVTELSPRYPANWDKDDFSRAQIDFVIYVPEQVSVNARGSFGDMEIKGIKGKCTLENRHGEIAALNISGDVDIENSFGDIKVDDVGGKAEITNRNGRILAYNIGGSAVIENHFGDIETEDVGGDIKIVNNNGRITVKEVEGKADLRNTFGDISIDNVSGGIMVDNKNGRIEAVEVIGDAQVKNAFGDIIFKSESINDGDIYAKTRFGSINCDKQLLFKKDGQDTVMQGRLGSGKYKIELATNNGDIKIE